MKPAQGIFAASLMAAFVGTLAMSLLSPEVSSAQFMGVMFTYTFVGTVFSSVCALVFGWPLSLVFRRIGFVNWWQFCIGGAVCAFPFWFMWFYPFSSGHWEAYRITNSLYFFGVGVLGGYFYWQFVVRPQPTNKASNPTP